MFPTNLNHTIRRQDRVMNEEYALELLRTGEYGFLAMQAEEGGGYGLPLTFVWDAERHAVYIHCAPEGRKLRCLAAEPRVSFCIVGRTHVLPEKFTTEYQSVLLFGRATADLDEAERMHALELILQKYCPQIVETGRKFAQASFHRTRAIRIDISAWSAKTKKTAPHA